MSLYQSFHDSWFRGNCLNPNPLFMESMSQIGHAKVSGKLQITIPKKVQEEPGGLNIGQYINFYKEGKNVYIRKGMVNPIE